MKKIIIGPSHLIERYMKKNGCPPNLFHGIEINGVHGRPNHDVSIEALLKKFTNLEYKIYYMISNYDLCNKDYDKLVKTNELFIVANADGGRTISPDYKKYRDFLGQHSCKILKYINDTYPHVICIPWCLLTRTLIDTTEYPTGISYNYVCKNYNNVVDIRNYVSDETFLNYIADKHGHPNRNGYELLKKIIDNE